MYGSKVSSSAYKHLLSVTRKHRTKVDIRISSTTSRDVSSSAPSSSNSHSNPPPPPQFEHRQAGVGSKLLLAIFGATAITGATLAYAKNDEEFRKLLKEYAPWTDDAIAMMYQEKPLPGSGMFSQITDLAGSASDFVFGSEKKETKAPDVTIPPPKIREIPIIKEDIVKDQHKTKETKITPKDIQPLFPVPPPIVEKPKQHPKERDVPIVSTPAPSLPVMPPSIAQEVSDDVKKIGGEACAAYRNGIAVLKDYKDKVNSAMEHYIHGSVGKSSLEDLKRATKNKMDAESRVQSAIQQLESCVGAEADKLRETIGSLRQEFDYHKSTADVASKFWPQVEEARKQFVEEIEAIFPHADITSEKLDTRGGDTDALLLIALRKVLMYKQQLAQLDVQLADKVNRALQGSDEDVIRAKIELALERERRDLEAHYQKKMEVAKAEWNKEMSAQLKRQLDIHQMHLRDTLENHTEQIIHEEQKVFEERLAAEKAVQGVKLATVLGRLQGVDKALKARNDVDKMAKQAQLLWVACEALEGALRGRTSNEMRVSVSKELDAIAAAAADSDELVTSVLRGVPPVARERGVLSEVALRDRFIKLEKVCRSLALVPAQGGSLHVFLLSWLQGKLTAKAPPPSLKELQDEPTDFSKLDTYDILQRARYCVDRGQWDQALRYIHLLKGGAATIAQSWAQELTLHLEARQAANALLAHAAASGLLYL